MDFKTEIFEKLWKSTDRDEFENWIYTSDENEFKKVVGENVYIDILSESYTDLDIKRMKKSMFDLFLDDLKAEFYKYIQENQKVIKAKCVKTKELDYGCKKTREWDLNIGQDYYIFRVTTLNDSSCHKISYQIFDPDYSEVTPYYVPGELFEIKEFKIPEGYIIEVKDGEIDIYVEEFSESSYIPVVYSFWEDYFDDHKKAVDIFNATLIRLGIKLDFETELIRPAANRVGSR